MKLKSIAIGSTALLLALATVSPVLADNGNDQGRGNENGMKIGQQTMVVRIEKNGKAELQGTLSSVSGNILNIVSWGGTWVVDASNAKLVRKFGGASSLSEFQNGDWITIMGTAATSGWSVTAKSVKNDSIQAKNASFSGTISNLATSSFTLTTKERGSVAVSLSASSTVWLNGVVSSLASLANGMSAGVSGVWNRAQSTVLANYVKARTPRTQKPVSTSTSPESH